MPTGYTEKVRSGEITTLRQYALTCARNFGACIMLRDRPDTGDIPVFEPNDYHLEAMKQAEREWEEWRKSTCDEKHDRWILHKRAQEARKAAVIAERDRDRARYLSMLRAVNNFVPPTADHTGLVSFMREQLQTSIDFDCPAVNGAHYDAPPFDVWCAEEEARITSALARHAQEYAKECERVRGRNKWVAALKQGLDEHERKLAEF